MASCWSRHDQVSPPATSRSWSSTRTLTSSSKSLQTGARTCSALYLPALGPTRSKGMSARPAALSRRRRQQTAAHTPEQGAHQTPTASLRQHTLIDIHTSCALDSRIERSGNEAVWLDKIPCSGVAAHACNGWPAINGAVRDCGLQGTVCSCTRSQTTSGGSSASKRAAKSSYRGWVTFFISPTHLHVRPIGRTRR